jgi:hypothetical protein
MTNHQKIILIKNYVDVYKCNLLGLTIQKTGTKLSLNT